MDLKRSTVTTGEGNVLRSRRTAEERNLAYLDKRRASTKITQQRGIDVQHDLSNGAAVYPTRRLVLPPSQDGSIRKTRLQGKAVANCRRGSGKQLKHTAMGRIPDNLYHERHL